MPRKRRWIQSKSVYEISFRAQEGLPFVAYKLIELLLKSAIARTQRDSKVTLCHDIWNGSHCHIIVVVFDAEACVRFYSELMKRITDFTKRLLGKKHLRIWEEEPMLALIDDLEEAKERIAYLYANPAQDNLVDNISLFPGYSSWKEYKDCLQAGLEAKTQEEVPWIRLPSIPLLSNKVLSRTQDYNWTRVLKKQNKSHKEELVRKPNAWMECLKVAPDEVLEVNSKIVELIKEKESLARKAREKSGKSVMGVAKLCSQPIMKAHTPKKKDRKINILSSVKERRIQLIQAYRRFCDECRECYKRWRAGEFNISWPPGAIKPPLPSLVNLLPI